MIYFLNNRVKERKCRVRNISKYNLTSQGFPFRLVFASEENHVRCLFHVNSLENSMEHDETKELFLEQKSYWNWEPVKLVFILCLSQHVFERMQHLCSFLCFENTVTLYCWYLFIWTLKLLWMKYFHVDKFYDSW